MLRTQTVDIPAGYIAEAQAGSASRYILTRISPFTLTLKLIYLTVSARKLIPKHHLTSPPQNTNLLTAN
jgi:hypothetical protein